MQSIAVGITTAHEQTARNAQAALEAGGLPVVTVAATPDDLDIPSLLRAKGVPVLVQGSERLADGVAAVRRLRGRLPEAAIVLVLPAIDRAALRRAFDAGVDGMLAADDVEHRLGVTVRAVSSGQLAFPRAARAELTARTLSFREKQVMGMVVMGFSNGEIARKLYLAESTVKSHLSSAFSKLGVASRHEAAALILDPDQSLGTGVLAICDDERRPRAQAVAG